MLRVLPQNFHPDLYPNDHFDAVLFEASYLFQMTSTIYILFGWNDPRGATETEVCVASPLDGLGDQLFPFTGGGGGAARLSETGALSVYHFRASAREPCSDSWQHLRPHPFFDSIPASCTGSGTGISCGARSPPSFT